MYGDVYSQRVGFEAPIKVAFQLPLKRSGSGLLISVGCPTKLQRLSLSRNSRERSGGTYSSDLEWLYSSRAISKVGNSVE